MHLLAVDKLLMHQHTVTHIEAHGGAAGNAEEHQGRIKSLWDGMGVDFCRDACICCMRGLGMSDRPTVLPDF